MNLLEISLKQILVNSFLLNCVVCPYTVLPLSLSSVHGVCLAIQAGGHLEGLDELGCSYATGTLRHDTCEAHLPLHVDLKLWTESRQFNLVKLKH